LFDKYKSIAINLFLPFLDQKVGVYHNFLFINKRVNERIT